MKSDTLSRFFDKIEIDPETDCWNWTGSTDRNGYGTFRDGSKLVRAARYIYGTLYELPQNLEIDHLCRNPRCACPYHMEPVSHGENMRRAADAFAFSGEKNGNAKHSLEKVIIAKTYNKFLGASAKSLSILLRIPERSTYYILGEGWNHIYLPRIDELPAENWKDLGDHLLLTFFLAIEEVYIRHQKPIPDDVIDTLLEACSNMEGLPQKTLSNLRISLHSFCNPKH